MGYLYVLSVNFTFIVIDTANVHLFIGTARGVGRGRDLVARAPPSSAKVPTGAQPSQSVQFLSLGYSITVLIKIIGTISIPKS